MKYFLKLFELFCMGLPVVGAVCIAVMLLDHVITWLEHVTGGFFPAIAVFGLVCCIAYLGYISTGKDDKHD